MTQIPDPAKVRSVELQKYEHENYWDVWIVEETGYQTDIHWFVDGFNDEDTAKACAEEQAKKYKISVTEL